MKQDTLEEPKYKTSDTRGWRVLRQQIDEFQKITSILTEYDERRDRLRHYQYPELHQLRKAVAQADPDKLLICLRRRDGYIYDVLARYQNDQGYFLTFWIHEDGIRSERESLQENSEHPVHSITCMSDLFTASTRPMKWYDLDDKILECIHSPEMSQTGS